MSASEKTKVLFVSTSGIWDISARAVLAILPGVELLDTAHGSLTAYQVVQAESPQLLIIDDSLPLEESDLLIRTLKAEAQSTYCILLVPTARHGRDALAAGADGVILRSGSSRDLVTVVEEARRRIAAENECTGGSGELS